MPLNKQMADDFFETEFEKKVIPMIESAKLQMEMTSRDGWKNLTSGIRAKNRQVTDSIANDLAAASNLLRSRWPDAETIKEIKECAKKMDAVSASITNFMKSAINAVKEPCESIDRLIMNVIEAAQRLGLSKPMHYEGLDQWVQDRISRTFTRYVFDPETWVVIERPPMERDAGGNDASEPVNPEPETIASPDLPVTEGEKAPPARRRRRPE